MSNENLYEYQEGEFQQVTAWPQLPAGTSPTFIRDENRVKMAGYEIELWDMASGGVQLVLDTDYQLSYIDATISGLEAVEVFAGYTVLTEAFQDIDLYLTAKIVGGYTARPYRPTYTNITADYTTIPSSVDDSVFADTTDGPIALTMADGTYVNQRFSVIASGDNSVSITGAGQATASYINQAIQYVWNGTAWLNLGGAGSGGSSAGNLGIGQVAWFGGPGVIPADKLLCDGTEYNIVDYPGLFGSIGTVWGGDGITTFAVPNFQGIHPGAIGTQDINGNTKGFPGAVIGDYIEDQLQGFDIQIDNASDNTNAGNTNNISGGSTSGNISQGAVTLINDGVNGDPRTGEFTDVSQAMGRWLIQAFDTVQEIPADPGLVKDYIQVWPLDGELPTASIQNIWGDGLFYAGIEYDYNGTTHRSNGSLAVIGDDLPREVAFDVDFDGGDSVAKFICDETGLFSATTNGSSDFTNLNIVALYQWGSVATWELNPPVDGWGVVYTNPDNIGGVSNKWGAGSYELTFSDVVAGAHLTVDITITAEDVASNNTVDGASVNSATNGLVPTYTGGTTNEFGSYVYGVYVGNITKIRKFNSLVNVVHSYAYAIGTTYQQLSGEGSPADMNMLGTWIDDSANHTEITWAIVWKRTE